MKRADVFSALFLVSILAVRVGVFIYPLRKIVIGGVLIHHFWIGAALVLLAFALPRHLLQPRLLIGAVGLGLVTDELFYMLWGAGPVVQYWAPHSTLGAIGLAALVLSQRSQLLRTIL